MEAPNKSPGARSTAAHEAKNQEEDRHIASNTTGTQGPNLRQLPSALAPLVALPHWVLWRWQLVKNKTGEEKWTKVPYQPNGSKARSNDPKTWSTYDTVLSVLDRYDGIGFCLFNSGYAAFDIDDARDPITGSIDPWAVDFVARAGSYTEITVSGTGLRIIGRGTGPRVQRKQAASSNVTLESYRGGERYIVMTGNLLPGTAAVINNIDTCIDEIVAELDEQKKKSDNKSDKKPQGRSGKLFSDLIRMIRQGCDDEQLRAHMANDPHVQDQANRDRYMERQIANAREWVKNNAQSSGHPNYKIYGNKEPISNLANALVGLQTLWPLALGYDEMLCAPMLLQSLTGENAFEMRPLTDVDVGLMQKELQYQRLKRLGKDVMHQAGDINAHQHRYHPVKDFLGGLVWDGTPRLEHLFSDYFGLS